MYIRWPIISVTDGIMKRYLFLLFLAALMPPAGLHAKTPPASQAADEYDVFLLIGQSNMAGRGYMLAADTLDAMPGVWLLSDRGVPEPARNPMNRYSSVRKTIAMQRISPATAFGTRVAEKTGRKVLIVMNALGGSDIRSWMKDAPRIKDKGSIGYDSLQLYAEAVRRTRQAMRYGTLKGILWHQGEANASRPQDYPAYLTRLVADLRKDLRARKVPFVAGELGYWRPSSGGFNEMIRTIGDFIPYSAWASARDAGYLIDEHDPHFSREGQLLLGGRYADKVLKLTYGIEPPDVK